MDFALRSRALDFARSGRPMKPNPDVLEHGWTRRLGPQSAGGLTAAQANEQAEYDKAVRCALKAMGY